MKKTLPILSISAILLAAFVIVMASCSSKTKTAEQTNLTLSAADTAGLAQFQEWKALNERKDPNQYYTAGQQAAPVQPAAVKKTVRKTTPARTTTSAPATQPATAKKKGWSKAAKGAVIGTATGAAAGAIINKKNRVLGGVIGGVIGGGIGYGIGRGMDKKDGRVADYQNN